ncbi:MAG: HMA2 domain-containing protein [Pirellulales bacterium]
MTTAIAKSASPAATNAPHGARPDDGWRVVHALPGRIRLRSPRLRGASDLADQIADELLLLPGLRDVRCSIRTGSVLVHFDAARLAPQQIVEALQRADQRAARGQVVPTTLPSWELTPLSLATGAIAEFATIAAAPPTALLLAGAMAPTVATACRDLARGRIGSPLVSTVILASTVASGSYFSAALMALFLRAWDRRYLAGVAQARQRAERRLRTHRAVADCPATRERISTTLHRAIDSACDENTTRGQRFADRTALPTLTTAAVGLAAGDLTTAAAILRPDYGTTPKRAAGLHFAHLAGECAKSGALVLDPAALERIAGSNAIVLDADLARRLQDDPAAALAVERLRTNFKVRLGLLGTIDELVAHEIAGQFHADFVLAAENEDEAAFELQRLQRQGHRLTLVATRAPQNAVTEVVQAAIHVGDTTSHEGSRAHILLFEGNLGGILTLWSYARHRERRHRGALWTTTLANVGCVAGAFVWGFTGLHVVLLTNLATWGAYRASLGARSTVRAGWQVPSPRRHLDRAAGRMRATYSDVVRRARQMRPLPPAEPVSAAMAT